MRSPMNRKPDHIYIVDDDSKYRKSLVRLLVSAGYFSEGFSSAQSFLDSVPMDAKGCVIVDVRMPQRSGLGLLKKLKKAHFNDQSLLDLIQEIMEKETEGEVA